MIEQADKLFARAVKYISFRDRSEREMADYLKKKLKMNEDSNLIESVIEKLKGYNLLNDLEFAGKWVRSRHRTGKGPIRIRMELFKKGVEKSIIFDSLSEIDDNKWMKSAKELVEKRMGRWENEEYFKKREKAMRFLIYRGFPLGISKKVIDQLVKRE